MRDASQTGAISARFSSVSAAVPPPSYAVSGDRAADIAAKAERVSEQARSHFDKHRQLWTNRQYGALLAREGGRMTLRPHGMPDDRKAHLTRAADALVLHRQAKRLARIERAADHIARQGDRSSKRELER